MNVSAPVSMLAGKGSGPAMLVIGLLIAAWLAQKSQAPKSTTR